MKFIVAICLFGLAYAVDPICRLTPETGPCRAYIPMYYYDSETGECQKFVYGGCDGNENRFFTEEECRQTCDVQESNVAICHLEPEKGMCLAYMPRYYYNAKDGRCERFIYGGCQGNPNNFKTLEECEATCAPQSTNVPLCHQKPETGMCRGYFPRYYYDEDTGKCSRFVYGGCGGNQNNFETEEECLQTCAARSVELPVCEQDAKTGVCLGYFPRYFYNKRTGQCEVFIYGGCGGNENNFKTKRECEENCQVVETESICELEAKTGPCRAYFPRYYYNKESGECERFIYGGCQGNANNFESKQECEQQCVA